ncbi:unnamed protein product [Dibothriocephalus latus]|uniref:Uncharacterized protein n=1 Tax=Dibothriocephalus latus TaxID=60516 RepID=A0A3P7LYR7_DIBLA|nr:unnamed protein product [Dibothriocephalus latus]
MHPTSIALIMISTSCLILAFKAYCIGMVWDCHRYLLLSNRLGPLRGANARRLPFFWSAVFRRGYPSTEDIDVDLETNPQDAPGAFAAPLPTEPLAESALPKYEEALNTPANAYAPPPYFPNPSKETEAEATPEKSQK